MADEDSPDPPTETETAAFPDEVTASPPLSSEGSRPPSGDERALGTGWGLFAAILTGFLYYCSFPGLDFWPAAFVAWVPWMVALRGSTPKQASWQGFAVGMVAGVLGFYWLMEMLQTFSGFATWLCAIFMLVVVAYQAGLFALLGWLFARGASRGWPLGLVFACAFTASETAYPLLFPFTFAATMHDVFPILQVAEIGGPILVSLVVLASNWALSKGIYVYFATRRAGRKLGLIASFDEVGWLRWSPLLLVPTAAITYGMVRIVQVDAAVHDAEKSRVGIVQANMSLEAKRNDREEGLKRHTRLTKRLVDRENVDLVVWPETSVAGAVRTDRAFNYYRKNVTRRLGVPAIVGAVLYEEVDDVRETIFFNSALISDESGKILGRYDKQFLLLFGEYLPFGDRFPILHAWSPNSGRFSKGTSFEPLKFQGRDIATFICYEDIVPSFVNKLMRHGNPELLVNMTNDAWFGDTTEPWEHMALAKLRAVEQRRYLVRSTNSGVSGFVDPVGRLTQRTKTFAEAAVAEDIAWLQLKTPYRVLGDTPWWMLTLVSFAFAFLRRPSPSARRN